MEFVNLIECIANDGTQNQFRYTLVKSQEHRMERWTFLVIPFDLNANDWYEFAIAMINVTTAKIISIDNRNMIEYRGKGITEKLIDESSGIFGVTIISSSNIKKYKSIDPEWHTEAATKIWKCLTEK